MSWSFDNGTIMVRAALVGGYENNAFVVACSSTGKGVIIDAAAEPDRILEMADGLEIEAVLTTHGHFDHIGAVDEVAEALGVPFRLHPIDETIAGMKTPAPLADGEVVAIGETSLLTVLTPGHTPGSVCFLSPGVVFSGDTLFPGGPGATRWDYSSSDGIIESISAKLFTLEDSTDVYPGHGSTKTTIGTERDNLPEWIARGW